MLLRCITIAVLLIPAFATAQKADTLRLYYAINEKENAHNYRRIDSTLARLNGTFVDVSIYGYADFLCGPRYNYELSKQRADIVKNYLLDKAGSHVNVVLSEGKGETCSRDNNSLSGEPGQRKVDVIIEKVVVIHVDDSKLKDPLKKDSAITEEPLTVKKDINELNVGESISIEGMNFEPGRHVLRKESVEPLKKLLTTLQENKNLKIEIQGHVCCIGPGETDGVDFDTHEPRLSENRARAVYNYLIQKGIKADRLSYKGFGGTQPKVWPENSFDDQQANRRVEIKVLGK